MHICLTLFILASTLPWIDGGGGHEPVLNTVKFVPLLLKSQLGSLNILFPYRDTFLCKKCATFLCKTRSICFLCHRFSKKLSNKWSWDYKCIFGLGKVEQGVQEVCLGIQAASLKDSFETKVMLCYIIIFVLIPSPPF